MKKELFYDVLEDISNSFSMLTIIPFQNYNRNRDEPNFTRAQWAFPLVGIFLGLITVLIINFFVFFGINAIISSTFGVTTSIILLGLLQQKKFSKEVENEKSKFVFGVKEIGTNFLLIFLLLFFLKINLIAELLKVDGYFFMIIGCYTLGIFSIVLIRKFSYSALGNELSNILGKCTTKNLLISTTLVFASLLPLGFFTSLILLVFIFITSFLIKLISEKFINITYSFTVIYMQVVEVTLLIVFNIWISW